MGGKRGETSSRQPQNGGGAEKERQRDKQEEGQTEGEMEGTRRGESSRDYFIT
jgi:hypothetical protein